MQSVSHAKSFVITLFKSFTNFVYCSHLLVTAAVGRLHVVHSPAVDDVNGVGLKPFKVASVLCIIEFNPPHADRAFNVSVFVGIKMELKSVFENAFSPMDNVSPPGNKTAANGALKKASFPIEVTLSGISMLVSPDSLNAPSPISVTVLASVIDVNFLHDVQKFFGIAVPHF